MAVTLAAGCSDMKVTSHYAKDVKLSGIGSNYSWAASAASEASRSLGGAEVQQALEAALEKELTAKGFKKSDGGPADFWVDYRLAKKLETDTGVVPSGETYMAGSLILDVVSPKTGKPIWRGIAEARINSSNPPEVRKQRLAQAVRELMKVFPPR
jgi:hypothetical protein